MNRALARVFLCAIFIVGGVSQIYEWNEVQQQIWFALEALGSDSRGLPPLLLGAAIVLQLFGAAAVLVGCDRTGAALLAFFLVPTTAIMHHPHVGGKLDNARMTHCLKNLAILGGLMLLACSDGISAAPPSHASRPRKKPL
eukprot:g6147.t1